MRIIRAGEHIQHIPGYGISVRESGVAVASNWWEVAGKTCVAAYQPKGAASYAASKVNLANPGTYDATSTSDPGWSADDGWIFSDSTNRIASSGYSITAASSLVIYFYRSGTAANRNGRLWFSINVSDAFTFYPQCNNVGFFNIANSGYAQTYVSPLSAWEALGHAAGRIFRNAEYYSTVVPGTAISSGLYLGNNDSGSRPIVGNIGAFAVYADTLTDAQMETVLSAMAAL